MRSAAQGLQSDTTSLSESVIYRSAIIIRAFECFEHVQKRVKSADTGQDAYDDQFPTGGSSLIARVISALCQLVSVSARAEGLTENFARLFLSTVSLRSAIMADD